MTIKGWPKNAVYRERYFVPDLSPEQRFELKSFKPELIFVAESPHEAETAHASLEERRPLCGRAGQSFWKMIGELLEQQTSQDTSLERLLALCRKGRFVVLNAVQFPLDPKINLYYGSAADPMAHLGFSKAAPESYKKLKNSVDVLAAIDLLRMRLIHPSLRSLPIISLGNDAQWFVNQSAGALGQGRHLMTVPHPSAWWRQGGKLREKARGQLEGLLVSRVKGRKSSFAKEERA